MFENLSKKLEKAFKVLKGKGSITEINVAQSMKEIRRALIQADVDYNTAKEFTNKVRDEALGRKVLDAVEPGQLLVKIVRDELATLMGSSASDISINNSFNVILIAGLQGSGKTTFSAKLANYLKKNKGKNPLLVACDVYRPAAIDQIKVLGEKIDVEVFSIESKNPIEIAGKALKHAKSNNNNLVIIDTAGRLAVDEVMMTEVFNLKQECSPDEILFVVDSMTGQDAVNTAKSFNEKLNFDGVVLTKLDGDTRGGAALTIKSTVNKPIKFISTGEKMDALDIFHPDRMADRILGMGDVVSLVERAQQQFDEEEAKEIQKKIAKDSFGFDDFLKQIGQIKKMGSLKDLAGMIPGVGNKVNDMDIDDDSFRKIECIIYSMTPQERRFPNLLNGSRRKRIAAGSGQTIQEVNNLIKQFEGMSKMMKMVQSGKMGMGQIMNMFNGKGGGNIPNINNL